jgi:hypothetical protein
MLGCFAFTEKGAGVLSGAGVETTATFDAASDSFVIHSPSDSKGSSKTWISQGLYAEQAVILAELIVDGESLGPHLFWADIADRQKAGGLFSGGESSGRPTPRKGVTIETLPAKTALKGLDNAFISFDHFKVARSCLLSRFCELEPTTSTTSSDGGKKQQQQEFAYATKLPKGVSRMLDLLIFRLLTGRIVLSEATTAHALSRLRHNWAYCLERKLWQGKRAASRGEAPKTMVKEGTEQSLLKDICCC